MTRANACLCAVVLLLAGCYGLGAGVKLPPLETARDFLVAHQPEEPGYGLYSYLLFGSPPTPASRDRALAEQQQARQAYEALLAERAAEQAAARPGGPVVGFELLREAIPGLERVGVLLDANQRSLAQYLDEIEAPVRALGIQMLRLAVRGPDEIGAAFPHMTKERAGALIVLAGPLFFEHRERIAKLAIERRLPIMSSVVGLVEAGGLMRYIADYYELWRLAARYVDAILHGADPAGLAVEQPTHFALTVNLRTARALGLTLPQSILIRADKVIE